MTELLIGEGCAIDNLQDEVLQFAAMAAVGHELMGPERSTVLPTVDELMELNPIDRRTAEAAFWCFRAKKMGTCSKVIIEETPVEIA